MPYCSYFFCYCVCMGSGRGKSRRVRFLAGAIRRARGVGIPPFTSEAERSHPKDGVYTDKNGTRTWWKSNKPHRDGGPAVETRDGYSEWRENGALHRVDGPAKEWPHGAWEWWFEGHMHRDGGPT